MKKYLTGLLVGVVMLAPVSVANAASNLSPLQVSLITQLIALLQQELNQLLMEESNTTPNPQIDAVPAVSESTVSMGAQSVEFTVTPQITVDTENPTMLDVHWETTAPVMAGFYLKQHPTDVGTLQQSFEEGTGFDYQVAKYSTPTFYSVVITDSEGNTQSSSGQLAANQ